MKTILTPRSSSRSLPGRIGFTVLLLLTALTGLAAPFGTDVTYQGRLTENGAPANSVNDFTFTLYDTATGGATVGLSNVVNDLAVTNGFFNVTLDFPGAFDGNARWLQIAVRPGASAGAYTNLVPRQPILATPYAIRSLSAGTAGSATTASGVAAGAVTSSGLAPGSVGGAAIADGSITSADLNASLLNNTFWKLTGNEVVPGQFLGSTNNQPVEIRANGFRALRLEPSGVGGSPNLVGGYRQNIVNGAGSTIAGGGTQGAISQVDGNYAFIGAGIGARAADSAFVGAGAYNSALGPFSVVGGGIANTNRGESSAIVAGTNNTITALANHAFIGGGRRNTSSGLYATVVGGSFNVAGGESSFAAGNRAQANHNGSFVWADSQGADFASTASNQFSIRAAGGVQLSPFTSMNFGQQTRQMLNLWSTNYGVGVQNLTTYFRTDSADGGGGFAWYQGGMHSDANQDPGAGGRKLMSLTGDGLLVRASLYGDNSSGGFGIAGRAVGSGAGVFGDNTNPNGWAGSFNGRVSMSGNVGIGMDQPSARLSVVAPGASELGGTAKSATLLTTAEALGTAAGNEVALASFGFGSSGGNNSSLGIRALRVADGSSWPSTAIGLGMDVDNTVRAGASLWLHANGNVGIGTSVPAAKLDVADGDIRLSSGRTISSSGRLHIQANEDLYLNPFGGAGTVFVGGGGGPGNFHVIGNIRASGTTTTGVLTITGGADIAEPFKMSGQDLPKGAVVVIDDANPGHLRLSDSSYDTRVAGVISGANGVNPGISLSQHGVLEGDQNVALSGRVYVQADASNGAIKPGDLLTTSATPGHAMKVAEHGKAQGAILGKAMTALADGKGMVLVLVTLQ